ELISLELADGLAPVGDLLKSNFLNELPLDLFGIELSKVVEIIANAPIRVGAFISLDKTMIKEIQNGVDLHTRNVVMFGKALNFLPQGITEKKFAKIRKYKPPKNWKEKYKAKDERSWLLRFHTQTAGCSLTAQQPENNIVRTAIQALSAVMGGTQSLHTNAMDETLALPSERAALIALRTQQVIAHETGVANTVDPLGGSYFVEALTDKMEKEAEEYFAEIEKRGGVLTCIEEGFFQTEIARAAYQFQKEIENKERVIVGVNDYTMENEKIDIPVLKIDKECERKQIAALQKIKAERDNGKVQVSLDKLKQVATDGGNTFEAILECSREYATLGEMCDVLRSVWGEHVENPAAMQVS
ncbi:MAG: hypothetical protein IH931_06280, partial [candidate division Zixibacteria bacterium]|nr:hypothetical protein [candidate division Zixibacteria bacterium]